MGLNNTPIAIKPKEFVAYKNGFTFKDFYIQYGRYHFDPTNNLIQTITNTHDQDGTISHRSCLLNKLFCPLP